MSFGFSVGDFIAAIQLANKIRKEFAEAPDQFRTVSNELRSLSIILQDADVAFLKQDLSNDQKRDLEDIDRGCRNVFEELERILEKYSELKSESTGKRFKRVWKRFKWEPEEINKLRGRISTNITLLSTFNGQITRDSVMKLLRYQEDREYQAILNWITPFDYTSQHQDFFTRRQEGTGRWLLDSAEFQSWLETDKQTMFCPGIPGAGKTILTSIVVEKLTTRFRNNKEVGIAYLYFNFRRQHEQKPEDMIASLLKQLLQGMSFLPEKVRTLYNQHNKNRTRPSLDEISSILHSIVTNYLKVFFIIDAIDECQSSDECRSRFLSSIFSLQTKATVKLFVTSRPNLDIEQDFKGCLSRDILAHDEDIRRYLTGHMSQLPSFVLKKPNLQEEIKTEIVKAVEGMFLLAQLYLQSLKDKTTARAIKTALHNFQKQTRSSSFLSSLEILSAAYAEAMDRINGQQKGFRLLANRVLSWIIYAKRPLTTRELQIAIAVEEGDSELDEDGLPEIEDMISVCAGLVTIDVESNIIRLIHYTTHEYFNQTKEHLFADAEVNITSICVTYLSFTVFKSGSCQTDDEFEERLRSNELFEYAAQNWGHHARKALRLNQTTINLLTDTLSCQAQVNALSQGLFAIKGYSSQSNYSQKIPTKVTGLHLAAHFGVKEILHFLFKEGTTKIDSKGGKYGQTPLSLAARNGYEAVVKLLLERGAELESIDSAYGQTPLSWAARNGHEAVVRLLLENGADLESKDSKLGQTPLSWAARRGYEAVVKLLLERGAEIDSKDNEYGRTPLSWAARHGHKAAVNLLLENGADLESKDDTYGQTPLSCAADNGYEAVAKLLLDKGAEIDSKDSEYGQTPLVWAIRDGHEAVVKLLLERGAKLDLKDKYDSMPLLWAAGTGNEAVVKLLLEKGADPDSENQYFLKPLWFAAKNGHEDVVKLLLEHGASPEIRDSVGRTPLWWAARYGNKVVQLLLSTGRVDVDTKDYYQSTPLSIAVRMGHSSVAAFLLTQTHSLTVRDTCNRSPLWWARRTEHFDIAAILLEKYEENGITSIEDDLPTTTSPICYNPELRCCDVCIFSIPDEDSYHHCSICNDGDFDICKDCFAMKAHCLDNSHALLER